MNDLTLGIRVKSRLKDLGKKPQWLADQIAWRFPGSKCDVKCISALISRKSQTTIYAIQIAEALEVSLAWLLDGTGSMFPEQSPNSVNQTQVAYENKVAAAIMPKTKREKLSERIGQAIERINEDGLLVAIGRIETLVEEYPREAKQTPSS